MCQLDLQVHCQMLAMLRSMQSLMTVAGAAIECLKGYLALQQIKCSSLETMLPGLLR